MSYMKILGIRQEVVNKNKSREGIMDLRVLNYYHLIYDSILCLLFLMILRMRVVIVMLYQDPLPQ